MHRYFLPFKISRTEICLMVKKVYTYYLDKTTMRLRWMTLFRVINHTILLLIGSKYSFCWKFDVSKNTFVSRPKGFKKRLNTLKIVWSMRHMYHYKKDVDGSLGCIHFEIMWLYTTNSSAILFNYNNSLLQTKRLSYPNN